MSVYSGRFGTHIARDTLSDSVLAVPIDVADLHFERRHDLLRAVDAEVLRRLVAVCADVTFDDLGRERMKERTNVSVADITALQLNVEAN